MIDGIELTGTPWGVMRCHGSRTLAHRDALAGAGAVIYVPTMMVRRRMPRSSRFTKVEVPMLGGFLFINSRSMSMAIDLLGEDASPMIHLGNCVTIPEYQMVEMHNAISAMTQAKREGQRKVDVPSMPDLSIGDHVTIKVGPLKGSKGTVRGVRPGTTIIDLGGFLGNVEISTFLLEKYQA